MLQPARRKYRKEQKGRNKGIATRGASVAFGDFGLERDAHGQMGVRDRQRFPVGACRSLPVEHDRFAAM